MVAKKDFYDYGPVKSYNAQINLIAGARGLGKTYGAKEMLVNDFFRKRRELILLRRYQPELKKASPFFFEDIAHLYPFADFRTNGSLMQTASSETRGMKKREWDTLGYFAALSQQQQFHGSSFPRVDGIIFDECILHRGGGDYIRDEAVSLMNFYSTVDRNRNTTKLYMLANAVEITNPYFNSWDISPETGREFQVFQRRLNGSAYGVCHLPSSENFRNSVRATEYGRFMEKTSPEYAEYAIDNKFHDSGDERIMSKTSDSKYRLTLETRSQTISVWYDVSTRLYYVTRKRPKNERVFVIDRTKMGPNKTYLEYGSKILSNLRTAWNYDRMLFDTPMTRNLFIDVFKR